MRRLSASQQWAGGCLAALAVPVILVGLFIWSLHRRSAPRPITVAEVSRRTGIRFPSSTRLTHGELRPPMLSPSQSLFVRLRVGRADVDPLIQRVPEPREVSRTDWLGIDQMAAYRPPTWWQPQKVRRFVAVRQDVVPDTTLLLLISRDAAAEAVVYLVWTSG